MYCYSFVAKTLYILSSCALNDGKASEKLHNANWLGAL
jgi:hypothetical protein